MSQTYQLVMCTCPDQKTAQAIAESLVVQGLAACVNIQGGFYSVYRWQEHVESAEEFKLTIKTLKQRYQAVENAIKTMHPYELPEIIAVDIANGSDEYLSWIDESVVHHPA